MHHKHHLRIGSALLLLLSCSGLAYAQQPDGTGLRGQYYAGQNFEKPVLLRSDPGIDFNWTIGPTGDHFVPPGPGVPGEHFSVRWTGYLYAPTTGTYTFQVATDDGMRVWVGGKRLVSSWRGQPVAIVTARVHLMAGRYYPVRVDYFQIDRDSRARLAWQPPRATEPQTIPVRYLYQRLPATAVPVPAAPPVVAAPVAVVRPTPAPLASVAPPRRMAPAPPVRAVKTRPRQLTLPTAPAPVAALDTQAAVLENLAALSKGAAVTLPNLYFTQSTASLLPASRPTLNALARTLRQQPALQLEIAGHTDNVGDAYLNLRLSEQRAQVVRRYLLQQGIDSVRLTARGYGGTRPVANNQHPEQRPRNRRVEVVVR
ncbi:PA14 domain-containing protein [Hymenobacter endophyticus]|uniref:PA14 domain-containing protein n=1 Tax=Hymenobacter endophyticus TaxID=3076335 RepID=A0ABU3TEP7_9BACT|nr:PA14 domain-containing protein [Hymenobacter endophyticus]MDU0369857.1 PA14 domain-containing protein [Hymenobacter endophyticus]